MRILLSNQTFFQAVLDLGIKTEYHYSSLITRLGVKPPDGKVVVLVIAKNEWAGHVALFDLFETCETLYGKMVELKSIRYVSCKDLGSARLNPNLEIASFILVADEDLLDAESYPELEQILPWCENTN